MWVAEIFQLPAVTDPKFGLFKHVLGFARIIYTLCPNSCRQTARIGGAAAPPCPPRPVRLWMEVICYLHNSAEDATCNLRSHDTTGPISIIVLGKRSVIGMYFAQCDFKVTNRVPLL